MDKKLKAKRFDKSWKHWILGFEAVQFLPLDLPDIDALNLVEQITEHGCTHACFARRNFVLTVLRI